MDKVIKKIVSSLKRYENVIAVYLFGSKAKGKTTALSDIDIAVFLHPYDEETARRVCAYSSPTIHTVVFNELPPYIKFEIVKTGKPVYVKDKETLEDIILFTMKEYIDYVPFYERQGLIKVRE
ncbi:MAG: nucleotidyltransferase domain-containing protein [Candidatus Anstonellales archaeon]